MIIYQATKEAFVDAVRSELFDQVLIDFYFKTTGRKVGASEQQSWRSTVRWMRDVLRDADIPLDAGICIEYQLPRSSQRVDFIISGQDERGREHAVMIEMKQWSQGVSVSEKDGIVNTTFYGETNHPSYQAWSYASLLQSFNATVDEENVGLEPCAYLHNCSEDRVIRDSRYSDYLEKAPVFLEGDDEREKLRAFIKRFVKRGDSRNLMYRIDAGKIRPSKSLADSLVGMLRGNKEFILIDTQKLVYETALSLLKKSILTGEKRVLVVQGGPGTGKSVVAVNLLVTSTRAGQNTQYVTKNAAPRAVFESLLTGELKKSKISSLFSGSGSYIGLESNAFDLLLVDEAHRLNKKSGMMKNLGEHQIKEIISASRCAIFFIDEDQRVTWHDIGTIEEIERCAADAGVMVAHQELVSQFRCGGSDGYLAWLDQKLQIRDTANEVLDGSLYDFRVLESPIELRDMIFELNKEKNKARIVAGYCWNWISKAKSGLVDICMPEYGFGMRWNLATDGSRWIISPESVNEAGCIHTCQGLDLEYVGVIIGPDLIVRDGKVITRPEMRASTDSSLKGYKKALKENPEMATKKADLIIKNTYRTLMTRGMKGCYVFSQDEETRKYFSR